MKYAFVIAATAATIAAAPAFAADSSGISGYADLGYTGNMRRRAASAASTPAGSM
jgi:hypothetical protein